MRIWHRTFAIAVILAAAVSISIAEERATATGMVVDIDGKPVDQATVLVYEAGVKKGYSAFCPTCYTDCGKRVLTDAKGNFAIAGLNPDLLFTLLVVRDGYAATYLKKVDPAKGPTENAVLRLRPSIADSSQLVRGRVVDVHGKPLRNAVVEQQGITYRGEGGRPGGTRFGPIDWIDQAVVTNEKGEFEIAYGKPAVQMILQVNARGMAPKLFTEATGPDRKTMTVTEGAVIRGRLVFDRKPVANAEIGLMTHSRASGTTYSEVRIGTQADGTFVITNVPAGRIWNVYPKMASLAARGIGADVLICETKDNGQEVDLLDIELKPAHTLRGRVMLRDGKAIPADMRVTLSAARAWDSLVTTLASDGQFEFHGLPAGVFSVAPAVKGYRLAARV